MIEQQTIDALLEAANPTERAIIAIIAYAGLNIAEALSLDRNDVLRGKRPRLDIKRATRAKNRIIDVDPRVIEAIDSHVAAKPWFSNEAPLFVGFALGRLSERAAQRYLTRLSRKIGRTVTTRDLRRFFISQSLGTLGVAGLKTHLGLSTVTFLDVHPRRKSSPKKTQPTSSRRAGRPRKDERNAELWKLVRLEGKSYGRAAIEYRKSSGEDLNADAVRMAVKRFEKEDLHRFVKGYEARGQAFEATSTNLPEGVIDGP